MKILGAIILIAILLIAVFSFANWTALTAPTTLSFITFDVQGPLGVILLGVMLALAALFMLYVLSLRTAMLVEVRRHKRELEAQRKLAESAEASRLLELRTEIGQEFAQLRGSLDQVNERFGSMENTLRKNLDETASGLAAHLGEIEDKLDQSLPAR